VCEVGKPEDGWLSGGRVAKLHGDMGCYVMKRWVAKRKLGG
jgi:hypothetical protein